MIDTRNFKILVSSDLVKVSAGKILKIGSNDTFKAVKARQWLSQSLQDAIRWLIVAV